MARMTKDKAQSLVNSYKTWHQSFEIFPGVVTPGVYRPEYLWNKLGIPDTLIGIRALDIGACDGFFSRELDKRGADVTALDYKTKNFSGFGVMESIYGKQIKHINANISDLPRLDFEPFDLVFCLGVLYHLPDPVRAMWDIRRVARGELWLETYIEHFEGDTAAARYYKASTLAGDVTNFWAPNMSCVRGILEDAGFDVVFEEAYGDRGLFRAKARPGGVTDNFKMQTCYGLLKTERD
jgi:tRNA (mo5U34)-methyltransferase